MINLGRLDLNLLLTLDVLLAEHNVTRAAQRLNLSQPTVSVQLARLREIFGDPLLLPGPRGMRPTARADELREPLRRALDALEQAVSPSQAFEPSAATHTWRVAATDYGESTIVLPALNALRDAAPGARLAVVEMVPSRIAKQAEQGGIDLVFHTGEGSPAGLHRRVLFTERYVLAGRAGHPRLKRRPTLAQFCALDHVIVSPDGAGFYGVTDEALAERGVTRRVVLSVPHFLFVLSVVASTDLVAMVPSRLALNHAALRVVEPPVEVPGYEMAMLWHERVHRDPAHKWLRGLIADSV
ncbi:LysR family transcriptional regulator [Paraburkholderia caballeronis]|uniref:DNA-binding transcriptional regulator, LysR family n=1 Tax=Paraburkholderia caballeronis TaxID=416943 RepID=A0A1H7LAT0_9BURK|nr:LysR family transcriptional regulator [Paraburkholderia caballeronis]PXW28381.1 DNA-binding transcriptional LysR family regulator [Paraburkholderia caballeronis]PXX03747.1 DNA-binding transcriptional LysR family regulator [Paraburkholderia caballeronis]RAK04491.1 DNA-binding transcriptional LysR family regulator [Paraburkholderia caballeronis]SED78037.1 DNA-binding transcriptional regulator, LysR family [Paraburkholderia caballeronis]SEK96103.1 DNA-binding transcriptional regulator, LysR fa